MYDYDSRWDEAREQKALELEDKEAEEAPIKYAHETPEAYFGAWKEVHGEQDEHRLRIVCSEIKIAWIEVNFHVIVDVVDISLNGFFDVFPEMRLDVKKVSNIAHTFFRRHY